MYLPPNALTKSKQLPSKIYLLSSIGRNALPLVKSRLQLINLTRKVINCKTINISLNIIPPKKINNFKHQLLIPEGFVNEGHRYQKESKCQQVCTRLLVNGAGGSYMYHSYI